MFTGIIKYIGEVNQIRHEEGLTHLSVFLKEEALTQLEIGASVAINGVCLTVVNIEKNLISFDLIQETLDKTNLKTLQIGDKINVERSAKFGDEIGGHLLSGHVTCQAEILQIDNPSHNHILTLQLPLDFVKYLFPKGYIALNGASLTLVQVESNGCFTVHLIPETLKATTFAALKKGAKINVELETQTQIIVDTIARQLKTSIEN